MNVIDVLAILPYYVSLFLMEPEIAGTPETMSGNLMATTTTTTVAPDEEGGTSFDDVRKIIQVFRSERTNCYTFQEPVPS